MRVGFGLWSMEVKPIEWIEQMAHCKGMGFYSGSSGQGREPIGSMSGSPQIVFISCSLLSLCLWSPGIAFRVQGSGLDFTRLWVLGAQGLGLRTQDWAALDEPYSRPYIQSCIPPEAPACFGQL